MRIKICGINYTVEETSDFFSADATHFGQVNYTKAQIFLNKDLNEEIKQESLCHEIVHAMLVHIGRSDLSGDEQFVQALGNAIYQTFGIGGISKTNPLKK